MDAVLSFNDEKCYISLSRNYETKLISLNANGTHYLENNVHKSCLTRFGTEEVTSQ